MKAMIFAAGMGTRLKPLTDRMPKALVEVCGKPLLAHVIGKLKSAGYDSIVINVHHFADMIEDYVRSQGSFGIDIKFSDEREELLETGGGILHARNLLETSCGPSGGKSADRFLVHNVDIISDLDLEWFGAMVRPDSMASLLVSGRKTSRYLLFDRSMKLVGWTNVSTGEIRSPYLSGGRAREDDAAVKNCKELNGCRRLAFSGIHSLSCNVFPVMEEYMAKVSGNIAGDSVKKFPIMDFYIDVCSRHTVYGIVPDSLRMVDVGKFASLPEAEAVCREIIH